MQVDSKEILRLKENLTSASVPDIVKLETMAEVRVLGDSSFIQILIDLLVTTSNKEIEDEIISVLNDLKDQKSVLPLVEAVTNERYKSKLTPIVAACWHCELDFSDYLDVFVDIVIQNEYNAAFEAFTVIENNMDVYPNDQLYRNIEKLKSISLANDDPKQALYVELIHLLGEEIR